MARCGLEYVISKEDSVVHLTAADSDCDGRRAPSTVNFVAHASRSCDWGGVAYKHSQTLQELMEKCMCFYIFDA